jgi:hypothetical protein
MLTSPLRVILAACVSTLVLTSLALAGPTLREDPGHPDSLFVDSIRTALPIVPVVPIRFYNDEPLGGLELTLRHTKANIAIDSFSFVGGRTIGLGAFQGYTVDSNIIVIFCVPSSVMIPTGSGLLGTLYFRYTGGLSPQVLTIDTVTVVKDQIERSTSFSDASYVPFAPQFKKGYINIQASCCVNRRGNADNSPDDVVDIADLAFLIDYLMDFPGAQPPPCPEEGNVDGSADGTIDISDLAYLIDWLILGVVPTLPACP